MPPQNYMQMICDLLKWWDFRTYDGFKSHVNFTEGPKTLVGERIRVRKEEAGTSALNQAYDKLQAKNDKDQTRQILELLRQNIYGQINQWQLIMIISTAIQNILAKVWKYYFVSGNLHPHHRMKFHDCINDISPAVNMGEKAYFQNHEGS